MRASCGVQITPWETFDEAEPFDYIAVVGGLLHSSPQADDETLEFVRLAARGHTTLVGICTGVFALMRAGALDGHRVCVSWFHDWDFIERFPGGRASHRASLTRHCQAVTRSTPPARGDERSPINVRAIRMVSLD